MLRACEGGRWACRSLIKNGIEVPKWGANRHADRSGGGHRNGHRRGKLNAAEGVIEYRVPQVRGPAG